MEYWGRECRHYSIIPVFQYSSIPTSPTSSCHFAQDLIRNCLIRGCPESVGQINLGTPHRSRSTTDYADPKAYDPELTLLDAPACSGWPSTTFTSVPDRPALLKVSAGDEIIPAEREIRSARLLQALQLFTRGACDYERIVK
jgi:hypothetical protein